MNYTKSWDELTLGEKADFCSAEHIPFLNKDNAQMISVHYNNKCINQYTTEEKILAGEMFNNISFDKISPIKQQIKYLAMAREQLIEGGR